jgi:regulator of protease activity HflC (stomatin/prohibitin superfamily)
MIRIVNAPLVGLEFVGGKPRRLLAAGVHIVIPFVTSIRTITTALFTHTEQIDVITRGGTPTSIKVGFTARVRDARAALLNMADPFATLRASVVAVVSGAANSFTIDELAQRKNEISSQAEAELRQLSEHNGWGLGDFQIAVGDPSMSEELKKLLMREEAVRRENAANLQRAENQLLIAQQLLRVSQLLETSPFAKELLRLQVLSDMSSNGKVVVIDSQRDGAVGAASFAAR